MPSILSDEDKQTVKRTVPKASNKIHAVAVAKLYIAYPDRHRWTYTGLQGAAVLANDLVGNTFWLKLVDISVSPGRLVESARLIGAANQPGRDMGPRDL
jgi:Wiskott-Aldrich syndrome protein